MSRDYEQEMTEKHSSLPKDIKWHMVGHVQRNKIKYMAPYVDLIHGIDSFKSLRTINKEGEKNNRIIKFSDALNEAGGLKGPLILLYEFPIAIGCLILSIYTH